ncbi:MAG: SDR family oxidoreductase [Myxococcota bacterium]|nr:SDR family oxidoreductase [Myxococcota bacterium]
MSYASGFRSGLFDDRAVLVAGGGGGLGRCIAHELASLGATLVLVGRTPEKLERTRDEIVEDGGRVAACLAGELRDEATVVGLVGRAIEAAGPLDGLVGAAGGQFPGLLEDLSLNGWNAVLHNNLTSYFLVSREVYRQSMSQHGGAIVHIGADYVRGMPGMGHNGAARAGLANLTMTSACEWSHAGVRVNCVIPGFIDTTGLDRYPESAWAALRDVSRRIPLRRHGTAAEVSASVVFLLSDMAAYVTGAELLVDGGARNGASSFIFAAPAARNRRAWDAFHRSERARLLDDDATARREEEAK